MAARRASAAPAINPRYAAQYRGVWQEEIDELEDLISTGATTAETVEQSSPLMSRTLKRLESTALGVLRSGVDTKWSPARPHSRRRSDDRRRRQSAQADHLHRAKGHAPLPLDKVRARLGNPEAVEVIHGGVSREERRKVVERFMQDKDMRC